MKKFIYSLLVVGLLTLGAILLQEGAPQISESSSVETVSSEPIPLESPAETKPENWGVSNEARAEAQIEALEVSSVEIQAMTEDLEKQEALIAKAERQLQLITQVSTELNDLESLMLKKEIRDDDYRYRRSRLLEELYQLVDETIEGEFGAVQL
jgi:hypothetical protein